jgi:hypothetical protein
MKGEVMRKLGLLVLLTLIGCTANQQEQVANPCSNGTPAEKGFVCVDAALTPAPNPVHQNHGGWVNAFMTNGDEIVIASEVFEHTGHHGSHAWGQIRKDAAFGPHKYTILDVRTGKPNDPEVMIDPSQ